jgi:DNA repair protein RecN (Recombination protein N)
MLVELRAENYAVIDHAIANFGPGLNLLTGETGAGKSILVDALALLMGGKSSAEVVRHGADKAVVACVFESTPNAETILEENGIDSGGNDVILRREILSTGKGRVFVNNQPATVAVLKPARPRAGPGPRPEREPQRASTRPSSASSSTASAASRHRRRRRSLRPLARPPRPSSTTCSRASRTASAWSISGAISARRSSAAHLQPGEDEALETEKRVLANAEKLYAAAMGAFEQLYEGGASAEVALRAALRNVEELARYDARFTEAAQQLAAARATVGDVAASLRDYAEGINASPERLAEIEDRLALLDRLKRKYGKTIAEVIAFGEEVARKLAEVEDRDEILKALRAELDRSRRPIAPPPAALTPSAKPPPPNWPSWPKPRSTRSP